MTVTTWSCLQPGSVSLLRSIAPFPVNVAVRLWTPVRASQRTERLVMSVIVMNLFLSIYGRVFTFFHPGCVQKFWVWRHLFMNSANVSVDYRGRQLQELRVRRLDGKIYMKGISQRLYWLIYDSKRDWQYAQEWIISWIKSDSIWKSVKMVLPREWK